MHYIGQCLACSKIVSVFVSIASRWIFHLNLWNKSWPLAAKSDNHYSGGNSKINFLVDSINDSSERRRA